MTHRIGQSEFGDIRHYTTNYRVEVNWYVQLCAM